jgi:hypothetical protein|tara:strand:- start:3380 stop:3673 length:294 start_codon:yes stop_codon:yes gene_type:complete
MAHPSKGSISRRLTKLATEEARLKSESITRRDKKTARKSAIKLIGTLGWGAMAKEVEQGKHTAAETLRHISTMKFGMSPEKRRIATLGAKVATKAGI